MIDFFKDNVEIVFVLIISIALIAVVIGYRKPIKNKDSISHQYLPKIIMSKTELEVYNQILLIIPKSFHLLAQVRLCDIVQVNSKIHKPQTSKWQSLFNKISRWHCDFVVINEQGKTIFCAELDDHTHRNEKRINRDVEFNKIFKQTEITLLRGDKNQLIELIKTHSFE